MIDASIVEQDTSEFNVIFIHSSLDDIGLPATQFRIYAHLARRAHKGGKAWPGIDSMAAVCKMHKETVIECLRELEALNMIKVERSCGKRSVYLLTAPSQWTPVGNGERFNQSEMGNGAVGNGERYQSEMGNVRISNKGNPKKEDTQMAEKLYSEYPKKVGKADALKKIQLALKKRSFDTLMSAVKAYAAIRKDQDTTYTCNPATWFHQGRYDDDQEVWKSQKQHETNQRPTSGSAQNSRNDNVNKNRVGQYAGLGSAGLVRDP